MSEMLPLLIVALIVWAGIFGFLWSIDRRVRLLEKQVPASREPSVTDGKRARIE